MSREAATSPPGGGEESSTAAATAGHGAGGFIGPYRLLSRIGEGGFGEVWLAERREPMVQRVAIKVIKPGMDSRAVIARFEQERQALAVMDHPNVARVLDAGTTPATMGSRPYFVMELVKGEPITDFCNRHRLTTRQRLELFIPVCEAIQHAHHKGLIHRDIKPSNVMVTMVETTHPSSKASGEPLTADGSTRGMSGVVHGALVKVIDFGVAKAVAGTLTDKTIYTEIGGMIGTPEYMSPEQAEVGATDVDTRSDVYSLGVLLYQLLCGSLPFDSAELRKRGRGELLRLIKEVDPPRPAARLAALAAEEQRLRAAARQTTPAHLRRMLANELEWIPLRAMRKERLRRYETTAEIARDVQRYLEGHALLAGPESKRYRARKFLARHRATVGVATLAALLILVATPLTLLLWLRAHDAEAVAKREESERAYVLTLARGFVTYADALAERAGAERRRADEVAAFLAEALGTAATSAEIDAAARLLSKEQSLSPSALAMSRAVMGRLAIGAGMLATAEPLLQQAAEGAESVGDGMTQVWALEGLAGIHERAGKTAEAADGLSKSVGIRERLWPAESMFSAETMDHYARALSRAGGFDLLDLKHLPGRVSVHDWLATVAPSTSVMAQRSADLGLHEEAESFARMALGIERQNRPLDHPAILTRTRQLAALLSRLGHRAEAARCEEEANQLQQRLRARRSELRDTLRRLASLLDQSGDRAGAEERRRAADEIDREVVQRR